jgi:hypothetical protein
MGELHVVSALRDKRSELAELVIELEKQLCRHRANLAHIDATMRLFDPRIGPKAVSANQPNGRHEWFSRGECRRLIYDVLHDAPKPMTTREITDAVVPAKGIFVGDVGVILLIGIVMKNAIMTIDVALQLQHRECLLPRDAIHRACLLRFRPIMMTTFAALFGAVPIVLGNGDGAELRQPLGIAIIGGLIVSQALTLYTTPVVYLYLDRLSRPGGPKGRG